MAKAKQLTDEEMAEFDRLIVLQYSKFSDWRKTLKKSYNREDRFNRYLVIKLKELKEMYPNA